MRLRKLLAGSSAEHLRTVAGNLGLASPEAAEIEHALTSPGRLGQLLAGLGETARATATRLALGRGLVQVHDYYRRDVADARALEGLGLAYAFEEYPWAHDYLMPEDLAADVRRQLAALAARSVEPAPAERGVAAGLQSAHDVAAVWAELARAPVRVKADGELYRRAVPKLLEALPPLDGSANQAFLRERRLDIALHVLRQGGFLRTRLDDRPGGDRRQELVPAGALAEALAREPDELRGWLVAAQDGLLERCAGALAEALDGRSVALASFGRALRPLAGSAGLDVHEGWADEVLALEALAPRWLAGMGTIGVDGSGRPASVALGRVELREPEGRLAVCQGNFEIVLLRPPTPAERLSLGLLAEAVAGQAHVFRITRGSARTCARALGERNDVLATLRTLVGEVPQNVERAISDWSASVRTARFRTALFVEVDTAAAADELLAGPLEPFAVERLGERAIAVPADQVKAVGRALERSGHEVEPGLERISGTWPESRPALEPRAWEAVRSAHNPARARGRQVSTLAASPPPGQLGLDDPVDVVLRALESGTDVRIVYEGANGPTERRLSPQAIDDERLHAWCHLRGDQRWFWLDMIESAELVS